MLGLTLSATHALPAFAVDALDAVSFCVQLMKKKHTLLMEKFMMLLVITFSQRTKSLLLNVKP